MSNAATLSLLSEAPPGEVTVAGSNLRIVFRRHLRAPVQKVWAALTIPERLADWFATATIDLRVGGSIHVGWADFRITESDPHVASPGYGNSAAATRWCGSIWCPRPMVAC
jgi:hypothetical protein